MPDSKPMRQVKFRTPPGATDIVVVRHGESQAAVEGKPFDLVGGHSDPPLADFGRQQAELVGERLATERVDAIYVTTLQRTVQTAAPLASRLGLEPIVVPELREVFLGEWEDSSVFRRMVSEPHPIAIQMGVEQRWDVIPGAESSESLRDRVQIGLRRIVDAHPDGRVVVVVHGGIIGELLRQVTNSDPWAFVGADNASISQIVVGPERATLRRFNDTAHLLSLVDDDD